MAINWLTWIGARGPIIIACGILVGLALPPLAHVMRPILSPLIFLMLVGAMVRVNLVELKACLAKPAIMLMGLVWILGISPLIALVFIWFDAGTLLTPAIALALILTIGAPPINSTPSLAAMLGLNSGLALALLVFGILAAPFTLFVLVGQLGIGDLPFTPLELFLRLGGMVVGAIILAAIIRWWIGEPAIKKHTKALDGMNVLMLVGFGISVMDGVTMTIIADPVKMGGIAALTISICVLLLVVTTALFWRWNKLYAATIGFGAANPNMGVIGGALGTLLPQDVWFFIGLLQIPIFLMPALLKPIYKRMFADGKNQS